MNRGFGYCDFERRSDHKNIIFKEVKKLRSKAYEWIIINNWNEN